MSQPCSDAGEAGAERAVSSRGPEIGVGLLLFAIAVAVIQDSLRVGAGWADDGPRAGYFPFYVGLVLLGASGWIVATQLLRRRAPAKPFATRSQLRDVAAVLVPMAAYVALIKPLGLYVASALLIGWFMVRHGAHRRWVVAAVAVGVPAVFFAVFEHAFTVPLPKGPLEALFGY